jgi:hypothetical protein
LSEGTEANGGEEKKKAGSREKTKKILVRKKSQKEGASVPLTPLKAKRGKGGERRVSYEQESEADLQRRERRAGTQKNLGF